MIKMKSKKQHTVTDKTLEKYKSVIDEWFVNGFNGTKAYQKIYTTAKTKTAEQRFSKLSSIVKVEEYITQKRKEIAEANKITIDECVSILTDMARFDIAEAYDSDGALLPIQDMPKHIRLAIESVESDDIRIEGVTIGQVRKIKTSSRRANVIELMKYLGGYEKHNDQKAIKIGLLTPEERRARLIDLKHKLNKLPEND